MYLQKNGTERDLARRDCNSLHFVQFSSVFGVIDFGIRVLVSLVQSQLPSMQELLVAQLTLEFLGGVRQLVIAQRVWPLELLPADVALV